MRESVAVMAAPTVAAARRGRNAWEALGELWCRTMHDEVTWPVRGHYHCKQCWRTYEVPFPEKHTGGRCGCTPAL